MTDIDKVLNDSPAETPGQLIDRAIALYDILDNPEEVLARHHVDLTPPPEPDDELWMVVE